MICTWIVCAPVQTNVSFNEWVINVSLACVAKKIGEDFVCWCDIDVEKQVPTALFMFWINIVNTILLGESNTYVDCL